MVADNSMKKRSSMRRRSSIIHLGSPTAMKLTALGKKKTPRRDEESTAINPLNILKVKTHIVTKIFKIDEKFIVLRFYMDFTNLKSTVQNVSLDLNQSLASARTPRRGQSIDMMGVSGLGISIQAYLKSSNFNLKNGGTNSLFIGALIKKAFETEGTNCLGGGQIIKENKLSELLDQLLVFDDLWIQQKKMLLKVLGDNIFIDTHSLNLKKTREPICKWINSKQIIEVESSIKETEFSEGKLDPKGPPGLLDLTKMSKTQRFNRRRKHRLGSKIDQVKSGIIQRRNNRKRTQ
jgi:hypothetical protein